ncbi:MAG TPA: hypothetical protein DDX39_00500 [Bacteroidales bacterium]|nr:MAG: hypothetical protein A2W98_09605 [Bacteroidetes bacterium GWF2_33_38]OFY74779.1 MAG: hypothetical protein A2265_07645 [Bacteroidetes bacterium RIFOXYA12_FULL_33_9]OFY89643.1 MAG: hypothetical protein A2236_00010 [Bacteroidetes bacterium RIFOXYA2_FULL_33_7]HBF87090.1 hypothetical protein [Bacteroidales bacterium]
MNNYTEISKLLGDLLFEHECVIIPNFGGFVSNPQNTIVRNGKLFLPPSKSVLFNKNLQRNDGLLINYIAERKNISYSEARLNVENFVHELNYRLKEQGSFLIEDIGAFHLQEEAILQFIPDLSKNYLISSYGLSSFSFPELTNSDDPTQVLRKHSDKETVRISINKNFVRKALISIPVMLVLTVIPFKSNINEKQLIDKASILPQITNTKNKEIGDLIEQKTDKKSALFYQEAEANIVEAIEEKTDSIMLIEEPTKPNESIVEPLNITSVQRGNFYIIAGSFTVLKQAENHLEVLRKQGFNPQIISEDKSRYRISIQTFSSKAEANNEISELRTKHKDLSVWLLSK